MHHNIIDYGPDSFITNIQYMTKQNTCFRRTLWTGKHMQLTLMTLKPGESIGLETHPNLDQFIRVEIGVGLVEMGDSEENLSICQRVIDGFSIIIPAGTWHNLHNIGFCPLKLYSIYTPPEHDFGTVHATKEIAIEAEQNEQHE